MPIPGNVVPLFAPSARDAEELSEQQMRQGAWLAAYEQCGQIIKSSEAAGINKRTYFRWMKDPVFAEQFYQSKQIAVAHLEDHAMKLATGDGVPTSERLLIKLLESLKPEVYNQPTRHEHSGRDGKPIEHNVSARESLLSAIASLTAGEPAPASDRPAD
jgi:hypothetical protein